MFRGLVVVVLYGSCVFISMLIGASKFVVYCSISGHLCYRRFVVSYFPAWASTAFQGSY